MSISLISNSFPFVPSLFGTLDTQPCHNQWRDPNTFAPNMAITHTPAPHLLDDFSSTFPSFEPSPSSYNSHRKSGLALLPKPIDMSPLFHLLFHLHHATP